MEEETGTTDYLYGHIIAEESSIGGGDDCVDVQPAAPSVVSGPPASNFNHTTIQQNPCMFPSLDQMVSSLCI
jgi:hypothetical protein